MKSEKRVPAPSTGISITVDLKLEQTAAFDVIVEELSMALSRRGIEFAPGEGGRFALPDSVAGEIVSWQPGERILMRWHPASWDPSLSTEIEMRFTPAQNGTRVIFDHRGWERMFDSQEELGAWFAGELLGSVVQATTPTSFGDWLTNRVVRRPGGVRARAMYRDPVYHYPNFRVILEELALTPDDCLIEIGCGGGALLRQALASGCRAAAIDHSLEMVRLTRAENHDAVAEGRLEVRQADASRLPFPDGLFTCAAMTGVLGFLPDPVAALREIRRVLLPGGRLVMLGSDPELRGTPAAPEPMASRIAFYDEKDLEELARNAGFQKYRVVRRNLERFARESGVPEEHMPLFQGPGARFLLARK